MQAQEQVLAEIVEVIPQWIAETGADLQSSFSLQQPSQAIDLL